MRSVAATTLREILRQHNAYPWAWLYELNLEYSTSNILRFLCCNMNAPVVWKGDSYAPFPVTHGVIENDSEGNMPQFQVAFSNARKDLARYVWVARGFVGMSLKVTVINLRAVGVSDGLQAEFEITGSDVTEQAIAVNCELPNFSQIQVPEALYVRTLCGWDYMGEECGYRGSLPTCNKDIDDCIAHGADEGANGRPVMHPRRFGAFLGLPGSVT